MCRPISVEIGVSARCPVTNQKAAAWLIPIIISQCPSYDRPLQQIFYTHDYRYPFHLVDLALCNSAMWWDFY